MASFADLYRQQQPNFNRGFMLGDLALQEQRGIEDTGYNLSQLYRRYQTRQLPGLIHQAAAGNAFYGGPTRQRADFLREDVGTQAGEMQKALARQRADIARRRTLIPFGFDVGGGGG